MRGNGLVSRFGLGQLWRRDRYRRISRWFGGALKRRSLRLWPRVLGLTLVGLALGAAGTSDAPDEIVKSATAPPAHDPRIDRLERFFEIYHCPTPYYTDEYLRAADDYALDYRLLPAVSIRETSCGRQEWKNNRWGYNPGRQRFPSIEVGIDFVARQLATSPLYKSKPLHEILITYNPVHPQYPEEVKWIMRQIE
jgi:hypothetical protein